jgi:hypothetical protein
LEICNSVVPIIKVFALVVSGEQIHIVHTMAQFKLICEVMRIAHVMKEKTFPYVIDIKNTQIKPQKKRKVIIHKIY